MPRGNPEPENARGGAGCADPRGRRISDEAKLKGVEEEREAAVEVAQEEDAPQEAGPEAAAGLTAAQPRARPHAPAAFPGSMG
jgi:hypothetical protein